MKLATYRQTVETEARLGVVLSDLVVDVAALGNTIGEVFPETMLELIDAGRPCLAALKDVLEYLGAPPIGTAVALANVTLLAPIPRLHKNIFGIGLNYIDHIAESALDHLFGYSVMIDVSARDCRRAGQWIYSKGQDTFAPFGPCIITADEIPDPQTLDLWLTINGVEKQRSNTSHMLFKVDELIADLCQGITLEPGDVIASGTPAGVGAGSTPQEWMWPDDVVVATVEGIGTLRHSIVDVTPA